MRVSDFPKRGDRLESHCQEKLDQYLAKQSPYSKTIFHIEDPPSPPLVSRLYAKIMSLIHVLL
jgi:hypothetical protein